MKILRLVLYLLLLVLVGIGGVAVGAIWLGGYTPNMLLELITGETPQAKIAAYLEAIQAQDRQAALVAWPIFVNEFDADPGLKERRDQVTDALLSRKITRFDIDEPEWWSTCCEPGVTIYKRNAGGARVRVWIIYAEGESEFYWFDVFTTDGAYFGDAAGNPYRQWLLRDVYRQDESPIFWDRVFIGTVH